MVEAFMRVLVGLAPIDQVLLAEGAALAVAPALVCTVADDLRLCAAFAGRVDGLGIVTEEDGTLAVKAGGVLEAKGEASVITTLVMKPTL